MILSKHLTFNYLCNGFLTISPPKTAINGVNLNISEKLSEKGFQNCLQIICTSKIKEDMILSKHLTLNYICNGFLTMSPPKTASNGGNLKITEKLSE